LIKSEEIRKKILFPTGIAFLIIMSVLTWQQCGYWKKPVSSSLTKLCKWTKNNYLAHNNFGLLCLKKERLRRLLIIIMRPSAYYRIISMPSLIEGMLMVTSASINAPLMILMKPSA